MIYFICFLPYEENGGNYWIEGSFVYSSIVLLSNLKILSDAQSIDFGIIFWVFFSILMYVICDVIFSAIPELESSGTFT
jgi:hypothetical protein